jgi:hypothetical protein
MNKGYSYQGGVYNDVYKHQLYRGIELASFLEIRLDEGIRRASSGSNPAEAQRSHVRTA